MAQRPVEDTTHVGYRVLYRNWAIMFLVMFLYDGVDAESKEEGEGVNGIEPARALAVCEAHGEAGVQHEGYNGVHDVGRCSTSFNFQTNAPGKNASSRAHITRSSQKIVACINDQQW